MNISQKLNPVDIIFPEGHNKDVSPSLFSFS
jgi:hypothetical protein